MDQEQLTIEALKRELAALDKSQPFDPVAAATRLLPPDMQADMPNIVREGADFTPEQYKRARNAERRTTGNRTQAYTKVGESPDIYVRTYADRYVEAAKGDLDSIRALAAIIAHEREHLRGGKAEAPAYDVQIGVLRQLGASEKFIKDIERARESAIHHEQIQQPQPRQKSTEDVAREEMRRLLGERPK
jgi:hypothetical protein